MHVLNKTGTSIRFLLDNFLPYNTLLAKTETFRVCIRKFSTLLLITDLCKEVFPSHGSNAV